MWEGVKGGVLTGELSVPSFSFYSFIWLHWVFVTSRRGWGRGFSVVVQRLSSYGVQAYLLQGQWDLSFLTKD